MSVKRLQMCEVLATRVEQLNVAILQAASNDSAIVSDSNSVYERRIESVRSGILIDKLVHVEYVDRAASALKLNQMELAILTAGDELPFEAIGAGSELASVAFRAVFARAASEA